MNLAAKLAYLGFRPEIDFWLSDVGGEHIASWMSASPQPTDSEIDAAALPAAKAARILAINAECRSRLITLWGDALEQGTRWAGGYGAAKQAEQLDSVAAHIDASNTASNAVLAAADIAAVEAVSVSWPAI